jgi:hypothetical protein
MKAKPLIYIVEDITLANLMSDCLHREMPEELETRPFGNPEEALQTFLTTGARPQILQASLCFAKGLQLAGRMKAFDPSIRFLLTSGCRVSEWEIKRQEVTPDAFLGKPFHIEHYLAVMQILLKGKPLIPLGYRKDHSWPIHSVLCQRLKKTSPG